MKMFEKEQLEKYSSTEDLLSSSSDSLSSSGSESNNSNRGGSGMEVAADISEFNS